MNWDMITKEIQQVIIIFGLFIIMIWLLTVLMIWLFIKSAVKAGVKQALAETTVSTSIDNITNGIVMDTRNVTPQQQYYAGQQYNGNWTQF